MQRTSTSLVAALGGILVAGVASAAVDNFDYPAGPLAGNNGGSPSGGVAFTGPWTNTEGTINVVAGFGDIGSAGGVSSSDPFVEAGPGFSQQTSRGVTSRTNTVTYIYGLVSIGNGDDDTLSNGFGGIGLYEGGAEKFLIGQSFSGTNWSIASNIGTTGGNGTSNDPIGDFDVALLVGKLDQAANTFDLYVNPDFGQTEADNTVDASFTFDAGADDDFDTVRLRGGSNDNTYQFDNLNITGDSPFTPIPEPVTALGGITMLGLVALRRRK